MNSKYDLAPYFSAMAQPMQKLLDEIKKVGEIFYTVLKPILDLFIVITLKDMDRSTTLEIIKVRKEHRVEKLAGYDNRNYFLTHGKHGCRRPK